MRELWRPSATTVAATALTRFAASAADLSADGFDAYAELWRWSVADLERFWTAVVDFCGLDLGPASGGVLAEVTVVSPSSGGYLTMYPCDDPSGALDTSVLNAPPRTNVANLVLMRTDAEGRICVSSTMDTDLLIDVIGRA